MVYWGWRRWAINEKTIRECENVMKKSDIMYRDRKPVLDKQV